MGSVHSARTSKMRGADKKQQDEEEEKKKKIRKWKRASMRHGRQAGRLAGRLTGSILFGSHSTHFFLIASIADSLMHLHGRIRQKLNCSELSTDHLSQSQSISQFPSQHVLTRELS